MMLSNFKRLLKAILISSQIGNVIAATESSIDNTDAATIRVLFIGNSYTFYSNLPAMLSDMANSHDIPHRITTKMIAMSAATLQSHWDRGQAVDALRNEKWDYVVLQEQSMRPIADPDLMHAYAKKFNKLVLQNGAKLLLFVTWAHKNTPDMQIRINQAYRQVANELSATPVPVGEVWQLSQSTRSTLNLYAEDGSHPSPIGTYLAACTFFQYIENVRTCPVLNKNMSPSDHTHIEDTVAQIMALSSQ